MRVSGADDDDDARYPRAALSPARLLEGSRLVDIFRGCWGTGFITLLCSRASAAHRHYQPGCSRSRSRHRSREGDGKHQLLLACRRRSLVLRRYAAAGRFTAGGYRPPRHTAGECSVKCKVVGDVGAAVPVSGPEWLAVRAPCLPRLPPRLRRAAGGAVQSLDSSGSGGYRRSSPHWKGRRGSHSRAGRLCQPPRGLCGARAVMRTLQI